MALWVTDESIFGKLGAKRAVIFRAQVNWVVSGICYGCRRRAVSEELRFISLLKGNFLRICGKDVSFSVLSLSRILSPAG